MQTESARTRAVSDTRSRILDVALEVLGQDPSAGMGEVASAAGVVRRTVYGHFPTRTDLVRDLTQRAASEVVAVITEVDDPDSSADGVWVDFVTRLWPLMHRYRVLVALRRGVHGEDIHALLGPVDTALAELVRRGQDGQAFGRHLPPDILSQIAYSAVFSIADNDLSSATLGVDAATMTSLLVLGVPMARATALTGGQA